MAQYDTREQEPGDKRPTFHQLLEDYHLTYEQVARRAGVDESVALHMSGEKPVFVEQADKLLQALSDLTGKTFTRAEVGRIYFRTDYKDFKRSTW